jgi:hypothetical protein
MCLMFDCMSMASLKLCIIGSELAYVLLFMLLSVSRLAVCFIVPSLAILFVSQNIGSSLIINADSHFYFFATLGHI